MGGVNCIQTFLNFWIFFKFTRSLTEEQLPRSWKDANISPIFNETQQSGSCVSKKQVCTE